MNIWIAIAQIAFASFAFASEPQEKKEKTMDRLIDRLAHLGSRSPSMRRQKRLMEGESPSNPRLVRRSESNRELVRSTHRHAIYEQNNRLIDQKTSDDDIKDVTIRRRNSFCDKEEPSTEKKTNSGTLSKKMGRAMTKVSGVIALNSLRSTSQDKTPSGSIRSSKTNSMGSVPLKAPMSHEEYFKKANDLYYSSTLEEMLREPTFTNIVRFRLDQEKDYNISQVKKNSIVQIEGPANLNVKEILNDSITQDLNHLLVEISKHVSSVKQIELHNIILTPTIKIDVLSSLVEKGLCFFQVGYLYKLEFILLDIQKNPGAFKEFVMKAANVKYFWGKRVEEEIVYSRISPTMSIKAISDIASAYAKKRGSEEEAKGSSLDSMQMELKDALLLSAYERDSAGMLDKHFSLLSIIKSKSSTIYKLKVENSFLPILFDEYIAGNVEQSRLSSGAKLIAGNLRILSILGDVMYYTSLVKHITCPNLTFCLLSMFDRDFVSFQNSNKTKNKTKNEKETKNEAKSGSASESDEDSYLENASGSRREAVDIKEHPVVKIYSFLPTTFQKDPMRTLGYTVVTTKDNKNLAEKMKNLKIEIFKALLEMGMQKKLFFTSQEECEHYLKNRILPSALQNTMYVIDKRLNLIATVQISEFFQELLRIHIYSLSFAQILKETVEFNLHAQKGIRFVVMLLCASLESLCTENKTSACMQKSVDTLCDTMGKINTFLINHTRMDKHPPVTLHLVVPRNYVRYMSRTPSLLCECLKSLLEYRGVSITLIGMQLTKAQAEERHTNILGNTSFSNFSSYKYLTDLVKYSIANMLFPVSPQDKRTSSLEEYVYEDVFISKHLKIQVEQYTLPSKYRSESECSPCLEILPSSFYLMNHLDEHAKQIRVIQKAQEIKEKETIDKSTDNIKIILGLNTVPIEDKKELRIIENMISETNPTSRLCEVYDNNLDMKHQALVEGFGYNGYTHIDSFAYSYQGTAFVEPAGYKFKQYAMIVVVYTQKEQMHLIFFAQPKCSTINRFESVFTLEKKQDTIKSLDSTEECGVSGGGNTLPKVCDCFEKHLETYRAYIDTMIEHIKL
ncbi:hypothetical protein NECID01_2115, partial [Nematocida sp. AWRm77]